jgi:hypothetical protein
LALQIGPKADGFRNYQNGSRISPEEYLVDRAQLLTLTAPERRFSSPCATHMREEGPARPYSYGDHA